MSQTLDKYQLLAQGIYVDHATEQARLFDLIRLMRPVKTRFELIRVGGDGDGGYLIPNDLEGIRTCFSPGVSDIAHFELEIQQRFGIESHLADYSVSAPPIGFNALSFKQKYLGNFETDVYMTLDNWVNACTQGTTESDLLLQMDIEGGEYPTLVAASEETLRKFRIVVLEVHQTEGWGDKNFFGLAETLIQKMCKHFHVVHNHPNNSCGIVNINGVTLPRVFELTFLRKDRAEVLGHCDQFPPPAGSRQHAAVARFALARTVVEVRDAT